MNVIFGKPLPIAYSIPSGDPIMEIDTEALDKSMVRCALVNEGLVIWHDAQNYEKEKKHVFKNFSYYGPIIVAKVNPQGQFIRFTL